MKRSELEDAILHQYPDLKLVNLKHLSKPQLESWLETGEVTIPVEVLVKIFLERNQRAELNQKLNNENFGLTAKLYAKFTDWSKIDVIQVFKKMFGKATKADDALLGEIGAVSKESVREDLDKAEQVMNDATQIAKQYQNKYGRNK